MGKDKRYSIITDNLEQCIECGRYGINKHEIFYGTGNRQLSIKYGLVIPLCQAEHHNQYQSKGIHFDTELCDKWHKIGQEAAMKHYNWTKDDFIKIFGRNYL
ncbi:MAG: hypothetical protein J6D28_04465 [Bacilli bacterium]|nr:hypothetical protein [Bacilli bacterium]